MPLARRVLCALALLSVVNVAAAAWPEKPVRIILPYAAGGGGDVTSVAFVPGAGDWPVVCG